MLSKGYKDCYLFICEEYALQRIADRLLPLETVFKNRRRMENCMLEKIVSYLKALSSKKLLRATLAFATVLCLTAGYVFTDASTVASNDSLHEVNNAYGNAEEILDSTDIAVTDDETEDETKDEVKDDTVSDGFNFTTDLNGEGDYTHKPVVITTKYETVTETIKFSYKTVKSNELYKGESKTTKGKNGEKEVVYCITVVNGVEMTREVESEKVTVEPVAQVETVGTKLHSSDAVMTSDDVKCISTLKPNKPIELDAKGQPVNYKKVYSGKSSAYCGCCDSNNTAYFGKNTARPGYVAVNPKQIPYGTKLYIVSADGKTVYGYAIAADTGGFAYNGSGRIVDLRLPTGSSCKCGSNWGVKKVNVYILG